MNREGILTEQWKSGSEALIWLTRYTSQKAQWYKDDNLTPTAQEIIDEI